MSHSPLHPRPGLTAGKPPGGTSGPAGRNGTPTLVPSRRGHLPPGDVGNGLHVLVSGVVKVVNDAESGEEAVLSILVPGDCFGELSLLDGEPRSARVEAMEAVETVMLDRSVFLQYFAEHPEMLMPVMIALCGVIRRLTEMVGDLTALDLEGRLAKKL